LVSIISTFIGTPFRGLTFYFWAVEILFLLYILKFTNFKFNFLEKRNFFFVNIYIIYNFLIFIYGCFISETYWDFKNLITNSLGLFSSLIFYAAIRKDFILAFLHNYINFALPFFFLIFFTPILGYGFYVVPITFLTLFWPVLPKRPRIIFIVFSIFIILIDFGTRSNVLKISASLIIPVIYYFRNRISIGLLEFIRKIIMFLPFILFSLAASGIFNVFEIGASNNDKYVLVEKSYEGGTVETNLSDDTRSFLYQEVLYSAKYFNSWIFGRTPARGHISNAFGDYDPGKRNERVQDEVAILNIFVWSGFFGVVLYFLVFYFATYLAISKSKNIFSIIAGLFLLFRWVFAWIEDINAFTLTNIFIWILIAFCYSSEFRNMSTEEVQHWINDLFIRRYKQFFN